MPAVDRPAAPARPRASNKVVSVPRSEEDAEQDAAIPQAPPTPPEILKQRQNGTSNGTYTETSPATAAAVAGVPGPVMPRRTKWVDIPEYPGFKMHVWVNYTQKRFDDLFSGDDEVANEASKEIFIEHNGWRLTADTPFPPMSDPVKFWDACSNELAALLIAVLRQEAAALPNSLLRPRARSAGT